MWLRWAVESKGCPPCLYPLSRKSLLVAQQRFAQSPADGGLGAGLAHVPWGWISLGRPVSRSCEIRWMGG